MGPVQPVLVHPTVLVGLATHAGGRRGAEMLVDEERDVHRLLRGGAGARRVATPVAEGDGVVVGRGGGEENVQVGGFGDVDVEGGVVGRTEVFNARDGRTSRPCQAGVRHLLALSK